MDVFTMPLCGDYCRQAKTVRYRMQLHQGKTLIELLMVMAIISILGSTVLPSFSSLLESNRLTAAVNQFAGALALSRSEAIKRAEQVVMCKSSNGTDCIKKGRWDQGWLIFVDSDRDRKAGREETRLRIEPAMQTGVNVNYRGFGSSNYIVYRPTGITQTNGTFTFCFQQKQQTATALILMKTGRVRLSKTRAGGGALKCP